MLPELLGAGWRLVMRTVARLAHEACLIDEQRDLANARLSAKTTKPCSVRYCGDYGNLLQLRERYQPPENLIP